MTFPSKLAHNAGRVEARLDALLSPPAAAGVPERLLRAMRHAVLGQGKRFRPFLVVESAALFGVGAEASLDCAAAFELVHGYSLVHDDLPAMDDDDLRRGQPTVHRAFDEWTAILVGDALQALAFDVLARSSAHPEAARRAALVELLARAAGPAGMAGGQCLDLEADKLGAVYDAEEILALQSMKTGALIRAACEAGAILGGATGEDRAALAAYGREVGLAFQLADDLLDATGDAALMGKATAKDAKRGKATLISLIGLDAARAALKATETRAVRALAPFGDRAATLVEAATFVVGRRV